jgi:two-component system, cell cycle response regulator DivK
MTETESGSHLKLAKKRILVADDRATSRELVRTALERSGYDVSEAVDGRDALEQIRSSAPDLVILDLHMPVVDGYEVVREIRLDTRLRELRVVALTASAMEGDRQKALGAGFDGFLTKPLSLASLRRELAGLLS